MNFFVALFIGLFLADVKPPASDLKLIKDRGVVSVATRHSPAVFEQVEDTQSGLELELAQRFADYLGVKLNLVVFASESDVIAAVETGQIDIGAARLTRTAKANARVRFGPAYQHVIEQLVSRRGTTLPITLADLTAGQLQIQQNSVHISTLHALRRDHSTLTWHEHLNADKQELLKRVADGTIDFTVTNSAELAATRRLHPDLAVALDVGEARTVAWALPRSGDDSLHFAVLRFFDDLARTGELDLLLEAHYDDPESFDYVGAKRLLRHIGKRLPVLIDHFKQAGHRYGIDWRLLAAIGYQESHWRADALSPTGVRGIMMLTSATADQLGVADRRDPQQSIDGGARYLLQVKEKIPQRIPEPDRTWLALAAYNVGYGHLEDARVLTQRAGKNPDLWSDVKQFLPLLADPKWYKTTRHGAARGNEPVHYTDNVRRYHDTLISIESTRQRTADSLSLHIPIAAMEVP